MTAPRRTAGGSKSRVEAVSRAVPPSQPLSMPVGSQTLTLEDFPSPLLARALSPNGRVHWAQRNAARKTVAAVVAGASIRARLEPARGPVRVTFRYVRPTRGRVDLDNLSTGVSKACLDALVRQRILVDDDSRHVVAVTAEAVYEKGRRALVVILEEAA